MGKIRVNNRSFSKRKDINRNILTSDIHIGKSNLTNRNIALDSLSRSFLKASILASFLLNLHKILYINTDRNAQANK